MGGGGGFSPWENAGTVGDRAGRPALRIRLLGDLQVERAGRPLSLPPSRKARALLGYLVATGAPQTRRRLCDLFWEGPVDPRGELRWSLSKLRPLLDEPGTVRLLADRESVGFAGDGVAVDLAEARSAMVRGEKEDLAHAAASFRGEFLEGLDLPDCYRFHEWLTAEREAARALRLGILQRLCERRLGEPQRALRYAREWVAADPLDEAGHATVMRLLGEMGRPREALQQYESCLRILRQELGVERSEILEAARASLGAAAASGARRVAEAETPTPAPGTTAPPALQGRSEERRRLGELLAEAAAGRPRPFVLAGEPGIGKSRLLGDLAERARAEGGAVLYGRAFEAERARPYGAWIDALRSALHERLESLDPALRSDLAALLPELAPGAAAATERARLFDAVARLLDRLASAAPAVVLLDDVQWLDESSAALLHFVARATSASRVLVGVAARPGELEANGPAAALLRSLARELGLGRLELGPLAAGDTAALAHSIDAGVDGARVHAESDGNPLFALEIARALARGESALPDSLASLIADRFAHLSAPGLALLPWAAAFGQPFDAGTLARVTALPPAEVVRGLEELERHRILRPAGGADGRHDFSHDLVRRAAYQQLSSPRRRLLHQRIAETLHAELDPDGALAGDVARHAALAGDSALAATACTAAAERALRLFALPEAAELAERGQQHLSRLPRPTALPLAIALLRVYIYATQGRRRNRELVTELGRLVGEARGAGLHPQVQLGLHLLAVLVEEEGRPAEAARHTLQAVEDARGADPATAVRALANTGRCLAQLEREPARAEVLLLEARALAERIGLEVIDIPWGLGLLHNHVGEEAAAVAELERAVAIAAREREHWSQAQCLIRLASIDLDAGRSEAARARCRELRPLASRLGEGSEGAVAAALDALAGLLAREAGADDRLEEALEAVRAVDTKGLLAFVLNAAAEHDLGAGRIAAARSRAREALEAASAVGRRSHMALARALLARVALAEGDRPSAAEHFEAVAGDLAAPRCLSARARAAVEDVATALGLTLSTPAPTGSVQDGRAKEAAWPS